MTSLKQEIITALERGSLHLQICKLGNWENEISSSTDTVNTVLSMLKSDKFSQFSNCELYDYVNSLSLRTSVVKYKDNYFYVMEATSNKDHGYYISIFRAIPNTVITYIVDYTSELE